MADAKEHTPGHVQVECDTCGADVGSAHADSYHHLWEDDVAAFLHHEVTPVCRQCCAYRGMLQSGVGHAPLLLARVKGKDEDGTPFVWIARRSRKRVKQPYDCPEPPPKLLWTDALRVKRHYAKPGWWVAFLFVVGSFVWLFTGIARLTKPVSKPDPWPPGLDSLSAGMSVWPEIIALFLMYLPACLLQVYEATNMDMECRMRAWEADHAAACKQGAEEGKGGGSGPQPPRPKPRPRLLPTRAHLEMVSWWMAMIQLLGILAFIAAVLTELIGTARLLSGDVYRWAISFLFFIGGLLFSIASWVATLEETGSHWRGVVPSRLKDLHSISWAAVFFALQGSLGFMIFGIVQFAYLDISWGGIQGIMVYGQIWASLCFIISSGAGLLEQANPSHL
ncbi:hypothetical protein HYH03_003438 [Edaphochlamys debaryana]|uniref:Uncharacterized protein n=1 Tax=Edaphochlamys debaryana TaxID=47281 RepID=A0A835YCE6_9CHLO|nr:hypothetical protein HYH03_003438 [Edaphochlamys debaryana]|eukprot:KAG2498698.1 hypothetical protein HYH03_003438 [Edaphochlamys debaryana]